MKLFTDFEFSESLFAPLLAIPPVAGWLWKTFVGFPQQVLKKMSSSGSKQKLGSEQEVLKQIDLVHRIFQKVSNKRIVVFVDDIDRASESKIIEVLEAIKLFLYSKEFVFVLAMDTKVVRRAIGTHYKFAADESQSTEDWGRSYLEKIIQIPFHLPNLTEEQRLSLCDSILEGYSRNEQNESNTDDKQTDAKYGADKTDELETDSKYTTYVTSEKQEGQKSDQMTDQKPITERAQLTVEKVQSADSYRGSLDKWEIDLIKKFSSNDDLELSPRLFKRFINIYLVARQLHQSQLVHSDGMVAAPPEDFIKWLALSVAFPFEIRALTKWLIDNNWENPLGPDKKPFNNNGNYIVFNPVLFPQFSDLNTERLSKLGRFINMNGLNMKVVENTLPITSCFSLILD